MRKTTKFFLLNLAISIAGMASPEFARGQFLGYTSPQTVVQKLATNTSCTGVAQTFVTANLGQTQHYATISGNNAAKLQMEIDGVDGNGNATRISDVLVNAQATPTPTTITGNGYFPIVQVVVTCSGGSSNFTVTYSGTSTANPQPVGGYQVSQIDKAMFLGLPANVNQTVSFQPPFGSAAGFVFFTYNTAVVSGSKINVTCAGNLLANFSASFNLATVLSTQNFQVPPNPCTALTLQYVSGGATAGTISAEYIFYVPGTQTTLSTPNTGTSSAPPIQTVSDSVGQAFFSNSGNFPNPGAGQVVFHVNAGTGTRAIYFDRMTISVTAAATVIINMTQSVGTTCSGLPITNMNFNTGITSTGLAEQICATPPSVQGVILNPFALAANTPVTLDLRGFIGTHNGASNTGIDVVMSGALVGNITATAFWYEK